MKRYAVFAGLDADTRGGWWDFRSAHDDYAEAVRAVEDLMAGRVALVSWIQLVDLERMEVVRVGC